MGDIRHQRHQLKALLEQNRKLAAKAWHTGHELDQLFSARKETLRARTLPACRSPDVSAKSGSMTSHGAASNATRSQGDAPCEPQPGSRPPVLIVVQNDPAQFALLKRALWKSGATARVWWARDAADALNILDGLAQNGLKICIVADVLLSDTDGFELLECVKQRDRSGLIRFAFLTGCDRKETIERANACGADAFFIKPAADDWLETARALQRMAAAAAA